MSTKVDDVDSSPDDATLYVRGLPADLVRQAKVLAAQRGTTLRAVVAEALRTAVRSEGPSAADGDVGDVGTSASGGDDTGQAVGALADDLAWYEANREALVKRYPSEYLAIVDEEVVDHGRDLTALVERTRARYNRPVLMPDTRRTERTVHLRSPRVADG